MITLFENPVHLGINYRIMPANPELTKDEKLLGRKKTMAGKILLAHNVSEDSEKLRLRFDAMVSPDNNYVNILQTARASGLKEFPMPYVLSNCHNTLCAVGGTILEDDHAFGLSNVKKFGGIFLPPYRGVLHQYMREMMAGGEKMILGSDSHTRYGALGTMGIGEGGGELVKQLLGKTYDLDYPDVVLVKLTGEPMPGVGPMDVAIALITKTFKRGFTKNKVLEVVGDGVRHLSMEYRMGIDVMTTESGALSSVWETDDKTLEYLKEHGREEEYKNMTPEDGAYYDCAIEIDLSLVEPMIALPFHPSHGMSIREFKENMETVLWKIQEEGNRIKGNHGEPFSIMSHVRNGEFYPDQALISGCAGGLFENIAAAADILKAPLDTADNDDFSRAGVGLSLQVNPASLPIMEDLMSQGIASELAEVGVTLRPCICGPCFGVTDVPANNQLSIRHVTRNYSTREGSKPGQGQMAAACLMDARSIAATVRNGGRLTAATELNVEYRNLKHHFKKEIYEKQVLNCYKKGNPKEVLVKGPNIADWPEMAELKDHLLLKVAGSYRGSVTTDELVPSGEASSYRSNPEKLSAYTLISRDPEYVERAKAIRDLEKANFEKSKSQDPALEETSGITFGSLIVSDEIGDGSSREQSASNQKVLGGFADLANTFSTKRYRSNLINWGLLPLRTEEKLEIPVGSYLFIKDIRKTLEGTEENVDILLLSGVSVEKEEDVCSLDVAALEKKAVGRISATLDSLTREERDILLKGCLINYYK